jgi:trehalose 6-phosphate phosphatase
VGPERPTAARYRLENVEAVLDWLGALASSAAEEKEARA